MLRLRSRICDQLLLIERLGDLLRAIGRKPKLAAGIGEQIVELEEQRRLLHLHSLPGHDHCRLPRHLLHDRLGTAATADPSPVVVTSLRPPRCPRRLDDAAVGERERAGEEPIGLGHKPGDLEIPLADHHQRGRLNAAGMGGVEAAGPRHDAAEGSGDVDTDPEVGDRTGERGVCQPLNGRRGPQLSERPADGGCRHRLEPQPLYGLLAACMLHDLPEDQFTLAGGVAGIDHASHVVAAQKAHEFGKPLGLPRRRLHLELLGQ